MFCPPDTNFAFLSITETIRLMMSLQVDRIKQNKIGWNSDYVNPNSQAYRVLEDESVYAVSMILIKSSRNKKDLNDVPAAPFSVSFSQLLF